MNLSKIFGEILHLPTARIDLMCRTVADVDSFYEKVTRNFYCEARSRHRKLPFIGRLTFGVALCPLPPDRGAYVKQIQASGRRNARKAQRLGYECKRIEYNAYLHDIQAIRRSADVRQGKLDADFLEGDVVPCRNPEPRTTTHDYPYFGVLKDGHLYAYAGVLVAGELAMIEHIYGHAARHVDGVVPSLLVGIAEHLARHYPAVKYYGYGSYFGASETMRRFKRKFLFVPHRVKWSLG